MEWLGRHALLLLPGAAVAVIAAGLVVAGVPRPISAARIFGGPTEGASTLSWRVEVSEREAERRTAPKGTRLRVLATCADGRAAEWQGQTNDDGIAEAPLVVPGGNVTGPVRAVVFREGSSLPLADGSFAMTPERWLDGAGRRGGWLEGHREGDLHLRAAASRGVFAVPFPEELWVSVSSGSRPVEGADVEIRSQGADVSFPFGQTTDRTGRLRVLVAPRDHSASLGIRARTSRSAGALAFELPVLPGAMRATFREGRVLVESPIERDVAYLTLTDSRHRLRGAAIRMTRDGRGGASGSFTVEPALSSTPLWAVLSSEVDTQSMARVGWPLRSEGAADGEPLRTLDVADRMLLDGTFAAEEKDALRRHRIRAVSGLFAVGAMVVSLRLLFRRARAASSILETRLSEQGYDEDSVRRLSRGGEGRTRALFVALFCIALGFAALSLFALLRN